VAYLDTLEAGGDPPRLSGPPRRLAIPIKPIPHDVDLTEYEHMWTTERRSYRLVLLKDGYGIPHHRDADGNEFVQLICDDLVYERVFAHMIRFGNHGYFDES
jgi:hypothetical protein